MTAFELRVEDWLPSEEADPRYANTAAALVISVGKVTVTKVLNDWSKTVSDRARVPVYPLAEWLAANWWRLHAEAPYETGSRPPSEWRLSHDLPAIGGGIVWPRVRFVSDDHSMLVSARALRGANWEPVTQLNSLPATPVSFDDFDKAVIGLIELVLGRLREIGVSAEPLASIWADVEAERSDAEVSLWRRVEARLGYDAGDAPDALMESVQRLTSEAGSDAAFEVLPLLFRSEGPTLKALRDLAVKPGIEARFPQIHIPEIEARTMQPWDIGRFLAHQVRRTIGQPDGPLEDKILVDLLGVRANTLEPGAAEQQGPVGLAVRFPARNKSVLHFRKRNPAGRRFESARFLAENLAAPSSDIWLPLTDRGTARQKLQRAFAAELLAPIDELRNFLGEVRTSEKIEDAGETYGVSPLAIRSHLANHGLLPPEAVAA